MATLEQCPRLLTTTRERGAQQLGPLPKEQSSEQGSNRGGGFLGLSTLLEESFQKAGYQKAGSRQRLGTANAGYQVLTFH